jgi:hypothetical protein
VQSANMHITITVRIYYDKVKILFIKYIDYINITLEKKHANMKVCTIPIMLTRQIFGQYTIYISIDKRKGGR